MRLIIIRHGETIQNVAGICQGQGPGELSENGVEQAKKLGLRFKDEKIDVIYSSDLQRAIDTANEILKYHSSLNLKLDKRLRERSFGSFEGKLRPDIDWGKPPKDVETEEEMISRGKSFIDEMYKQYKDKTVVAVSHGGMKRAFYTIMHNIPVHKHCSWDKIKNTSVSEFEFQEDGNHKIKLLNCTNHLDDDVTDSYSDRM